MFRFKTEEEAIRLANDTEFGLAQARGGKTCVLAALTRGLGVDRFTSVEINIDLTYFKAAQPIGAILIRMN